jgi:serine/threonine protein kinase
MAKNYQLIHCISTNKQQTSCIYAAIQASNNPSGNKQNANSKNANSFIESQLNNKDNQFYLIKCVEYDNQKENSLILVINKNSFLIKIDFFNEHNFFAKNEISKLKNLRHPNLLPLLGSFVKDTQIWCIYPSMYFGSCKDILDAINAYYVNNPEEEEYQPDNNNTHNEPQSTNHIIDRADEQKRLCFNEHSLQPITKAILSALEYLHSRHILHRSICPENIYISQSGQIYLTGLSHSVSLIDQGNLYRLTHDYPCFINDNSTYLSPEILQQNLIGYNEKSDIYSLGVTLCELANGVNPFVGLEKAQVINSIFFVVDPYS